MRCDEVVRELATPTAGRDRAAMAEHLAACPACAEWARRAALLDQLWEATRPSEPSREAWDAVWAHIAQAIPVPAAARHEDLPAFGPRPSLNGHGAKILAHAAPAPTPAPAPAAPRPRGRSWRLTTIALVGLAQAAAILVALGLAWQPPPRPDADGGARGVAPGFAENPGPAAPAPIRVAAPVKVDAEIQEGRWMLIREEGPAARLVDATPPEMNTGSDGGLVILNVMEWIATPQVAAR